MVYKIKEEDRKYIEEFKKNPIGKHSPQLQRILNLFRGCAMEGKYVLVCTEPHKKWALGQFTGVRGEPIKMTNRVFDNIEAAEWHVFKERWKYYTGEEID